MNDFENLTGAALVLGGSGGLGRAVVRLLAQRGSDVVLTYRNQSEKAERLADECNGVGVRALAAQLDLTDSSATEELVDRVVAEYGGVHTLIYAAGPHVPMVHLSRVSPEQFQEQLLLDSVGFFNAISASLPSLREQQGSIVAITTAATQRYPVRDGLSSAPKAAVEALVRGLAAEEGRYGVRANCVGPGMLTDGMAERLIASGDLGEQALDAARANIPMHRFGVAVDIAEAVCFLASPRAAFISGQKLDVDGGYGV